MNEELPSRDQLVDLMTPVDLALLSSEEFRLPEERAVWPEFHVIDTEDPAGYHEQVIQMARWSKDFFERTLKRERIYQRALAQAQDQHTRMMIECKSVLDESRTANSQKFRNYEHGLANMQGEWAAALARCAEAQCKCQIITSTWNI